MGSLDGDCAVVYDGQFWEYAVFVGEGKVGETRAVAEVFRLGCIRDFARLNTEISKTLIHLNASCRYNLSLRFICAMWYLLFLSFLYPEQI